MKLGHGNCHKSHGKVMEKSWKFVGKNVYEPCIFERRRTYLMKHTVKQSYYESQCELVLSIKLNNELQFFLKSYLCMQ